MREAHGSKRQSRTRAVLLHSLDELGPVPKPAIEHGLAQLEIRQMKLDVEGGERAHHTFSDQVRDTVL